MAMMPLAFLPAASSPHSRVGPGTLSDDLSSFHSRLFSNRLDVLLVAPLVEKAVGGAPDVEVWDAVYNLVASGITGASDSALSGLRKNWTSDYLPDSLDVLEGVIRDNESQLGLYYARTLEIVQSSGMGKSRLADAFGKRCPMINFVLEEEATYGFPPADPEILSFINMPLLHANRKLLEGSTPFPAYEATAVWRHCIAVGLIQASLEKCKLRMVPAIHLDRG
jgi:hypothetical protein